MNANRSIASFLLALFSAVLFAEPGHAATRTALPSLISTANVFNEGFEIPDVGTAPDKFRYQPAGSGWTLDFGSGIAENGSAFGNAAAPQGNQVLLLQNLGAASYSFTVGADRYRLTLRAAQRPGNSQRVAVKIDDVLVGEIQPADATFSTFVFDALKLSAGSHVLKLQGLADTSDHTMFIDEVVLKSVVQSANRWSNASTWGGTVPQPGDKVVIPANVVLVLDSTVATNGLVDEVEVNGELHCADQNITLSTKSMMVHGRFVCGSPFGRYLNNFTLTLRGDKQPDSHLGMGNKVLAAMDSGVIELHGEQRKSWVQLAATADPGATTMTVTSNNQWRAGDKLVLAPTGASANEAEVVTVSATASNGTLITFSPALQYRHYGQTSSYSNSVSTWLLDERGEVGLLTRNIRIEGAPSVPSPQFGGHFMSMVGTQVHASGIELYRMGQKSIKARYPFHWHLVGDAPGQYIENSSVHESYNRCIVVHQTNRVRVADNVCYNFIGHGYFLEDGNEQFNVFDRNLGVYARKPLYDPDASPPIDEAILETDRRSSGASNGPAVFWISHPNNTITNNVAAGTQGSGYWYHLESDTTYANPAPNVATFGVFNDNRVHSGRQGFTSCLLGGNVFGMDSANANINRLTVSNVEQGIWPCKLLPSHDTRFDRAIVANTENGMQAPMAMRFTNSAFIAYTGNAPLHAAESREVAWSAIWIYDQGFLLDNVHFVNYDRRTMSVFQAVGGAHKLPNNRVSRLSFQNSPNIYIDLLGYGKPGPLPAMWGEPIHDLDGSFVGAGKAMTSAHPLSQDAKCARPQGIRLDGYVCPYRYATFRIEPQFDVPSSDAPYQVTTLRSDGVQDTGAHYAVRFMHPFITTDTTPGTLNPHPYVFSYRFVNGIPRNNIALMSVFGSVGGDSVHELMDVPANYFVATPGWVALGSIAAVKNSSVHAYFYNEESRSLFVKFKPFVPAWSLSLGADESAWNAEDGVTVCMSQQAGCPATARTSTPPSVAFASPAVVNGGLVTFTGSVGPWPGKQIKEVRLLVDDVLRATTTVTPHTFNISLANGVHVAKLVALQVNAQQTDEQTYTAMQRVVVGDTEPRIALANIVENGTYVAGAVPALGIAGVNPPAGTHLHWIDNDIDQGDVGSSLALNALTQGQHDIAVAYAKADHSVTPIQATRRIYIVANDVLADFEDGTDARATFTPHGTDAKPQPFTYAWGYRQSTRIDNQDDINFYDAPYVDGAGAESKFRLSLAPQANWNAFQRIDIAHSGRPFNVYLLRAGNVQTLLNTASPPASGISSFALPAGPKTDIVGIELRQAEPPAPAACAATPGAAACLLRQHLNSITLIR